MVLPHIRGRLLDIGCGTNELVAKYQNDGIGVDIYQWGRVDLVVGDSSKLPFNDGVFDTVTIIAALNHIRNRCQVLQEAHRILKSDGRLIITMIPPTISRLWHILRSHQDSDQKERGMGDGEVFGLIIKDVRVLLAESKFYVLFEKRFMLGVNSITVAQKKENS